MLLIHASLGNHEGFEEARVGAPYNCDRCLQVTRCFAEINIDFPDIKPAHDFPSLANRTFPRMVLKAESDPKETVEVRTRVCD